MHPLTIARIAIKEHGALQKDAELAAFLALLADVKPKVVVEIGSDTGGTLWAWRQVGAERVIGVDLPRAGFHSGRPLEPHGSEVVYGDSHDPKTLENLKVQLAGDPVDLLFIDGDHTYAGVRADYEMYSPLVRAGGLVAFHDICNHPSLPQVQVNRLWAQLGGHAAAEEIVTDPPTWGGIGVLYKPVAVDDLAGVR